MSIEQRTWQILYFFACLIIYAVSTGQAYITDQSFFEWLLCREAFSMMYGIVFNIRIITLVFWGIMFIIFFVVDLDKALDLSEKKEE